VAVSEQPDVGVDHAARQHLGLVELPLAPGQQRQVPGGAQGVRVLGTEHPRTDAQDVPRQGLRLVQPARVLQQERQRVHGVERARVLRSDRALLAGQRVAQQRLRLGDLAPRLQDVREVAAAGERVRMVGAEHARRLLDEAPHQELALGAPVEVEEVEGQRRLRGQRVRVVGPQRARAPDPGAAVQRLRLRVVPEHLLGAGQHEHGRQRVGMVGAERALADGEGRPCLVRRLLVQAQRLRRAGDRVPHRRLDLGLAREIPRDVPGRALHDLRDGHRAPVAQRVRGGERELEEVRDRLRLGRLALRVLVRPADLHQRDRRSHRGHEESEPHRGRGRRLRAVPAQELAQPVPGGGRPRQHRLVPQVARDVGGQLGRGRVAARAVLVHRLQRDPVEVAADLALAQPRGLARRALQ
jgi:hypothetical protein